MISREIETNQNSRILQENSLQEFQISGSRWKLVCRMPQSRQQNDRTVERQFSCRNPINSLHTERSPKKPALTQAKKSRHLNLLPGSQAGLRSGIAEVKQRRRRLLIHILGFTVFTLIRPFEAEARADALFRTDDDGATVFLQNLLTDRQTEPGPFKALR